MQALAASRQQPNRGDKSEGDNKPKKEKKGGKKRKGGDTAGKPLVMDTTDSMKKKKVSNRL